MFGSVRCSSSKFPSFSFISLTIEDLAASVDSLAVSFDASSGCSWSLQMFQKQRGDGNIPGSSQGLYQYYCSEIWDDLGSKKPPLSPVTGVA